MTILKIVGITFAGYLVGACVLAAMLAQNPIYAFGGPFLAIFGWPLFFVAWAYVGAMWKVWACLSQTVVARVIFLTGSALLCGVLFAVLVPREQGSEAAYMWSGFVGGVAAAFLSGCLVVGLYTPVADQVAAPQNSEASA